MDNRIDIERLELVIERMPLQCLRWEVKYGVYSVYSLYNEHVQTNVWNMRFLSKEDLSMKTFKRRGVKTILETVKDSFPIFYAHLAQQFPAPVQIVWEEQDNGDLTGVGTVVEGVPRTFNVPPGSTKVEIVAVIRQRWPGRNIENITPEQLHQAFRTYKSKPGDERTNPLPVEKGEMEEENARTDNSL